MYLNQINARLMNIKDFFEKQKKSYCTNSLTGCVNISRFIYILYLVLTNDLNLWITLYFREVLRGPCLVLSLCQTVSVCFSSMLIPSRICWTNGELSEAVFSGNLVCSTVEIMSRTLSRLGRDLNKVIILDNSPASYIFHPENAVRYCHPFFFCMHLLWVSQYIMHSAKPAKPSGN